MPMESAASIHAFWFGENFDLAEDGAVAERQAKLWWGKDAEVDAAMGQRFASLLEQATNGKLDAWAATGPGLLSLVLLTGHYRQPLDWTEDVVMDAKKKLDRLYGALRELSDVTPAANVTAPATPSSSRRSRSPPSCWWLRA